MSALDWVRPNAPREAPSAPRNPFEVSVASANEEKLLRSEPAPPSAAPAAATRFEPPAPAPAALKETLESAGLVWIETDPSKTVASTAPVEESVQRVPRARRPPPEGLNEPIEQVETRK